MQYNEKRETEHKFSAARLVPDDQHDDPFAKCPAQSAQKQQRSFGNTPGGCFCVQLIDERSAACGQIDPDEINDPEIYWKQFRHILRIPLINIIQEFNLSYRKSPFRSSIRHGKTERKEEIMIDLRKNHYLLALIVLVITVAFAAWRSTKPAAPEVSGTVEKPEASDSPLVSMQTETERVEENKPEDRMLVGVWFPYMSFTQGCDEAAFKAEFESKLETVRSIGANAVFVHVRPFADSLYPSEYEPWSHILTGEQGKDPGYDPLQIMVEAAHSKGLEFHAWINPLRISTG